MHLVITCTPSLESWAQAFLFVVKRKCPYVSLYFLFQIVIQELPHSNCNKVIKGKSRHVGNHLFLQFFMIFVINIKSGNLLYYKCTQTTWWMVLQKHLAISYY